MASMDSTARTPIEQAEAASGDSRHSPSGNARKTSDRPPKPAAVPTNWENVPRELHSRIVAWGWEWKEKDQKYDKPPVDPIGKFHIDAHNSAHWFTADRARELAASGQHISFGFVALPEDGI